MPTYRYDGPGPYEVANPDGGPPELIKPGDEFDLPGEPVFGPWELLPGGEPEGEPQTRAEAEAEEDPAPAAPASPPEPSSPYAGPAKLGGF